MQRLSVTVLTLGNLQQFARLQLSFHLAEHAVWDGTDGSAGLHHDVVHHTDIQVGLSAHQLGTRLGRDVVGDLHRVVEGAVAAARPHQVNGGGEVAGGDGVETAHTTSTHRCCHHTRKGVQSCTDTDREFHTCIPRHVHLVRILQRRTSFEGCRRAATRWVAQDINQHRCRVVQDVRGAFLGLHVHHVCFQWFGFVVRAVHLQGHAHGGESIVACQQIGCLCSLYRVVALTLVVQMQGVAVGGADHTVVDGHHAARELHHVDGVALRVVVIVVFLRCRDGEAILAVGVEHRMSEGVVRFQRVTLALRPVLFPHTVCQRQLLLVAAQGLVAVVVVAEVVELFKALLLVVDDDWRVVDAAVLRVVFLHGVFHILLGADGLPRSLHHILVRGERVGQVDHVARLSVLEQGGIARGGDLLYLPLHRWQQHLVFACMHVRIDHLAVQGGVHLCLLRVLLVLFIGSLVLKHLVALLQVAVLDVEHQSGGVVALQREHHLQAVAQVVGRETVAQWLLALFLTAHDTSGELHALRVVEDESRLVGLEVVGRQRVGVFVVLMVESVAPEGVSVLHRLDAGIAR